MDEINYTYDGKFEGNILIVGRTGCGKTTFVRNLGKNKLFGNVKEIYWLSKIELSNNRKDNIRNCFTDQIVTFDYPNNLEKFDDLLEKYGLKKGQYIENDLGENMIIDKFANFLTVSRKYGISCVYIFYTMYPKKQNWQMIMSQTKIFNFFFQGLFKVVQYRECCLLLLADRKTRIFLPEIFGLTKVKQCLTIDTRDTNDLGPRKFRTQADNRTEQIYYYNGNKKDTTFNYFLAKRKETSSPSEIIFFIVKVIDNVNKHDNINFDTNDELSDFTNEIVQRTIQRISESDTFRKTTAKRQHIRQRELIGHGRVIKKPRFLS